MPTSQLSSDNLRNARQALVVRDSLNIFLAIKHLDLGLGRLLLERIFRTEVAERNVCFANKNLVQKGRWLPLVKDLSNLDLKIFLSPLAEA